MDSTHRPSPAPADQAGQTTAAESGGAPALIPSSMRFALRMTVAAVAAFMLGELLHVPLHGLWAVLTAVLVTQASVGASIRASLEYVVGTLIGALYATLVTLLIPHPTPLATAAVLAVSIAPLAYAAAHSNMFRVAPFTAVIVLLLAGQFGLGPLAAAATRVFEVMLGGALGVTVSLALFPEGAYRRARQAAVSALQRLADALPLLLAGCSTQSDPGKIQKLQDDLGCMVASFDAAGGDARHEQSMTFGSRPDLGPLSRTLLRLRHDLVIIGRAAAEPLPQRVLSKLAPRIAAIGSAAGDYLRAGASALRAGQSPPAVAQVDAAMNAYSSEVAAMQHAGLTGALASNELERLFSLTFALDQLRRDLTDLARCIGEWKSV